MPGEWREPYLIRANGGPVPDTYTICDGDLGYTWPLPDVLRGPAGAGGRYVKVSESQAGPQVEGSHVVRGAEYEWQEEPK